MFITLKLYQLYDNFPHILNVKKSYLNERGCNYKATPSQKSKIYPLGFLNHILNIPHKGTKA